MFFHSLLDLDEAVGAIGMCEEEMCRRCRKCTSIRLQTNPEYRIRSRCWSIVPN